MGTQNSLLNNETKICLIPISDQRIFNLKKFQTSTNRCQVLEICILFKKKISKHKDDRRGGGMTDDRRVVKVFGGENRRSKDGTEGVKQNAF